MEKTYDKEIATVKTQVTKAFQNAGEVVIKNPEDLVKATELLSRVKTVAKNIKILKEGVTKPLNEALRNARLLFSPMEDQVNSAERVIKGKMIDYQNAEEKKAAKKEVKIVEKVETGKMDMVQAAEKIEEARPATNIKSTTGSANFKKVKNFRILDESLIPREYLVIDMVKVRKVALAGVAIPGVEVYEESVVASR